MAAKDRIRRLEARMGLYTERPCSECGGRIIYAEHHEDGSITYPLGEPCQAYANKPWGGRSIGVIEVVAPGANDVL